MFQMIVLIEILIILWALEGDSNSQYYNNSNSFKASLPKSFNKDFSFIHLNINSLGANGDKAKAMRKTWILLS